MDKTSRESSSDTVVVLGVTSVAVAVVVVAEEDGFVGEVTSKCDGSDTKTRERALESVPAREGTGVSPGLAVGLRQKDDGWMDCGRRCRRTI